jgi:hypothetical protein
MADELCSPLPAMPLTSMWFAAATAATSASDWMHGAGPGATLALLPGRNYHCGLRRAGTSAGALCALCLSAKPG